MITGQFFTNDNKKCSISIGCSRDITLGVTEGYYLADNPIEINVDNSDTFSHIIKTTCKICILTKSFIPELYTADDLAVPVTVTVDGSCVFSGYVKPFCYNQPYADELTELTIECQDYLCSLENHKYGDGKKKVTSSRSFRQILNDAFSGKNLIFDNSITVQGGGNVFDNIYVNDKIFIGEEEDDLKTKDEVITIILKFLNLHIIQIGNNFYIFNYKKKRDGINGATVIPIDKTYYKSDDTQISIADVYNQFIINCDLDEEDEVVNEQLDTDNLSSPYTNFNIFCQEWNKDKAEEKNDWFIQYYDNMNWVYNYINNNTITNISSAVEYNSQNIAVSQTEIPKKLLKNPLVPMILSMGKSKVKDKKTDNSPSDKPSDFTPYTIISVNGHRNKDAATISSTIAKWNDIVQKTGGIIKYSGGSVSSLTPTSDDVTNYICIKGTIHLQPAFQYPSLKTVEGWHLHWTEDGEDGETYERDVYVLEEDYDIENYPTGYGSFTKEWTSWTVYVNPEGMCCQWYNGKGLKPLQIGELKNPTVDDDYNLLPPIDYEYWKEKFGEYYGSWFYYRDKDDTDTVSKIPILVCQLKVGDKYLVEPTENNFKWVTTRKVNQDELIANTNLKAGDDVWEDSDGTVHMPTFTVGIDPKIGDFLLATDFDIPNTIDYQEEDGMYIPIKKSDGLAGDIDFRILSPSYSCWSQNIRRHPTWFRSTKWWVTELPLMEYVQNIFIKGFEIISLSDNGNKNNVVEKDLVYMSSVNETSVKEAEEITFEISTGLTSAESADKGVITTPKKNNIYDSRGNVITKLVRSDLTKYSKAEEFYIDDYYNEYKDPKLVIETSLDTHKTGFWDLYTFSYFNGKTFYPIAYEYDVKTDTTKYTLKEK